ncbi:succinyl-diaminopimelate desuccinylase [Paucibacter sp. DJ2R-2]|uniref:succinyl-diaminopimelate desuccinylase n=1 Tax=Paucibacter sp. DJ2R-2 TaxID=2893558 RepID=UPI0021E4D4E4|nr:succinyl-diaminopimelate desuccinylase [Paucibacter sp. DJ2R-2]MCV2422924.1 succinyl-diaminopimelate desuccinylase [Paucibacter sp. DJ4R-1]MCV2440820.1 succinyl-diaminopimelate desuccinylase [Paucibacter sp. DJ2R-2]
MSDTLALLEALVARPSVTPDDAGCLELIGERLSALGFELQRMDSGPESFRVSNLWAIKRGRDAEGPVLMFAGHTDVVPPGRLDAWTSDPFVPSYREGRIYGRGVADMKGSLAAMVVAAEEFVRAQPEHSGSLAFLLTSDEEGPSVDGTKVCCEQLKAQGQRLDFCIVGEPTSVEQVGDMIKNGRRGTLSGKLKVKGVQGHVAYPQLARNPVHQAAAAIAELAAARWDEGNDYFPATTFQISNIHAGTGATNVIPGDMVVDFNFRFSTESTPEGLKARVQSLLARHGLEYALDWTLGGEPFLTPVGTLSKAICAAIEAETGRPTQLSTTGGTSDGRFIAKICPQVIEFGPINASIHKVDEYLPVDNLEPLKNIYRRTLELLLA